MEDLILFDLVIIFKHFLILFYENGRCLTDDCV